MREGFIAWLDYVKERGVGDIPFIKSLRGKRVLNIGCGNGTYLAIDKDNWVGIDVNKDAVKAAKAKGYNAVLGSATDCPFEDGSFDGIIAYHVIEHLAPTDAYKMLKEIARLLKKNGSAYMASPMPSNVWGTFTHIRPYPPEAIRKILGNSMNKETESEIEGLKMDYVLYYGPEARIFGIRIPLFGAVLGLIANMTPFLRRGYLIRLKKNG